MPVHLAVDNSNRLLPAKKRNVEFYAKGRADLGQARMNIDRVGKPSDLAPVANPAGRHVKLPRRLTRPSELVDDLVNCHHGNHTYSRGLKKSSGLKLEKIKKGFSGKLAPMKSSTATKPAAPLVRLTSIPAIALRLVQTRQALGLSQSELCRLSGIAPNTYNQWERSNGRPQLDKALMLCETFGLTLDWVYRGDRSGLPYDLMLRLSHPGEVA